MEKMTMRRQAKECLLFLLASVVLAYIVIIFPLSLLGIMPQTHLLIGYYAFIMLWSFVYVWGYFVAPRFIVRRCRSCGSKNMLYNSSKKFFCGDCGHVLMIDSLRGYEKWKLVTLILTGPVTLIGVSLVVGCVLAGTFEFGLLFVAVLGAIYVPSVAALFLGLYKLFGRFAASFVREHKGAATTIFFIVFCILAFLILAGYWMLLLQTIFRDFAHSPV